MKVCGKCHILCETVCPHCGERRKLKEPSADEPVLLVTLTAMQAMLVEPVLKDSGLTYYKQGVNGGAVTVEAGWNREIYRFFVPFALREQALQVIEGVFINDTDIMRVLHEFDCVEPAQSEIQ